MGRQAIILVMGLLLGFIAYSAIFNSSETDLVKNYTNAYARIQVRNITRSALEMSLSTLADNMKWRSGFDNIALFGGRATVTLKDVIVGKDSAILLECNSKYVTGRDITTSTGKVLVGNAMGTIPAVVRAAFTAFGSINAVISDMVIDGRDYKLDGITVVPNRGKFGVSTGQSSFVNDQRGAIGGTTYSTDPPQDILPAYPNDPRVIETSSPWPKGFPTDPDAALDLPAGTLEYMAKNKLIPGSQFVTQLSDLKLPLRGITYIKVPPGTVWRKTRIGDNPEGIFVFHSDSTDAFWNNIRTESGAFKGIMLFDNVFHIHMDITGATVILTSNTITKKECKGNDNHKIVYSSEAIQRITGMVKQVTAGGWRDRLTILSWTE